MLQGRAMSIVSLSFVLVSKANRDHCDHLVYAVDTK